MYHNLMPFCTLVSSIIHPAFEPEGQKSRSHSLHITCPCGLTIRNKVACFNYDCVLQENLTVFLGGPVLPLYRIVSVHLSVMERFERWRVESQLSILQLS